MSTCHETKPCNFNHFIYGISRFEIIYFYEYHNFKYFFKEICFTPIFAIVDMINVVAAIILS